jgi:hypothetical protein
MKIDIAIMILPELMIKVTRTIAIAIILGAAPNILSPQLLSSLFFLKTWEELADILKLRKKNINSPSFPLQSPGETV